MRSTRLSLLLCLLGSVVCTMSTATAVASEPFFPKAGSHAYDVSDYVVRLDYEPRHGGRVRARVRITATALRKLDGYFSLDFVGPRVTRVAIGGRAVNFEREGAKLGIFFPERTIPKGRTFNTFVSYRGVPPKVTDLDGSEEGWYRTDDGVIAVGEPQGTAAWIPCNNVPWDKAEFLFEIGVPAKLRAVANGRQEPVERSGGYARYTWWERDPMSPYLAMVNIGRGQIVRDRIGGIPTWTLIDPRLAAARRPLSKLPEIVHFLSGLYGDYPFESAGSAVDFAPGLGYALETQSRPIYAFVPDLTTVVHETAHQWFGNSVGLKRWPQIWLNEGFATWSEWYYAERHGRRSAAEIFRRLYRVPASNERFWNPPPARLGSAKNLFAVSTYVRGGMALEALRQKIGTGTMLRLLRRWVAGHEYGSADIGEFTALAEQVSGQKLDALFQRWLYQRGKPR